MLWEKIDDLLRKLNLTLPPMILLMPYKNTDELKKKISEINYEALDDTNFEDFKLLSLEDDYIILEPLIRHFEENNRLITINISDKSPEQIFKEISQIIEESN